MDPEADTPKNPEADTPPEPEADTHYPGTDGH